MNKQIKNEQINKQINDWINRQAAKQMMKGEISKEEKINKNK